MMSRTEERVAREERWRDIRVVVAGAGGFLILLGLFLWNAVSFQDYRSQHHADVVAKSSATAVATAQASLASRGKSLAADVNQKCQGSAQYRVQNPTQCTQASQLATAAPSLVPGPPGASASDAQVQAAVNAFMRLHPPPIDYGVLQAFVNSFLVQHPAPSGKPGVPGASGQSGQSGQPGVNGTNGAAGSNGTDGTSGTTPPDAVSVTDIHSSQDGDTLTLTFVMSKGDPISVDVPLPNSCPATMTVTPPDPGVAGSPGDPTTPYPVCVPT